VSEIRKQERKSLEMGDELNSEGMKSIDRSSRRDTKPLRSRTAKEENHNPTEPIRRSSRDRQASFQHVFGVMRIRGPNEKKDHTTPPETGDWTHPDAWVLRGGTI